MALLAAYYAIFVTPPLSRGEKVAWILGLFALFVLELTVIVKERARQDREYVVQLKGIEESRVAHMKGIEDLRSVAESRTAIFMQLAMSVNDPVNSLKGRALRLSEQILEFVYHRLEKQPTVEPPYPKTVSMASLLGPRLPASYATGYELFERMNQQTQEALAYNNETIEIYRGRFERPLRQLCDEMIKSGGVKDPHYSWLHRVRDTVPTTLVEMKALAQGIGQVAGEMQTHSSAAVPG